jgi:hypothetical protein
MVKVVATKLSTNLPVAASTIVQEIAVHLAAVLLMTKINEENGVFIIKIQQDMSIIAIIIIAYHK